MILNLVEGFGYHTFRQTLATPAYLDWRARLRKLYEAGDRVGCLIHWSRGLEVQHIPPVFERPAECDLAPNSYIAACTDLQCSRYARRRGGFEFPFIGTFTRKDVLVEEGLPPLAAFALAKARPSVVGLARLYNLVQQVARHTHPKLVRGTEIWLVWRDWKQGERRWREPSFYPVASREPGADRGG